MMSAGGVGVVSFERIHSTLHGARDAYPSFLHLGSVSAHRTVADDARRELLSAPPAQGTVQSATDLQYALQLPYLSLKKEGGGVQVWRTRDWSGSAGVPISRLQRISDLSEAAGASEERIIARGEEVMESSGSVEADGSVNNGLLSSEGDDFNEGFKFNLFDEIKDLGRRAETLKEEVMSLDYTVSPTPYTPVEGAEAFKFGAICVLLLFVFWLGNYYVPDLVFKNTVFRKQQPEDPLDPTGKTPGDNNTANGSGEGTKTSKGDGRSSSGVGFSQSNKQNRPKSAKRK